MSRRPLPAAEWVPLIQERTKDSDELLPPAACPPLHALLGSHLQGDGGSWQQVVPILGDRDAGTTQTHPGGGEGSKQWCALSVTHQVSMPPGPVAPPRHSSSHCWCLSRPCSPCDAQPPPRGPGSPALGAEAADSWCCTHQGRQCCGSCGSGGPFQSLWYGGHSTAMGWMGRLRGTTWGCLSGASQVTQVGGVSSW